MERKESRLSAADVVLLTYHNVYSNPNDNNPKINNILLWFVMEVLPIVHVSSQAKNNWHPFVLVGGSAPLYSAFITSSNEAFALFLLNYYRSLPPAKETKITKKLCDKQQDDDDNNQEDDKQQEKEEDNEDNKKCIYKNKIDIHQGEKDYKKWMTTIKEMKKEKGKQGVDKVDKCLALIISNYRKQLIQRGVDVTERVQEVVDVPDDDDHIDFEAVGICGV